MSIDYSILEEFNINKELAIKYINDSTQVRKYVEAICDTSIINSIAHVNGILNDAVHK